MNQGPDMSRKILNANVGVTNVIPENEMQTTMMQTFDELLQVLAKHCGPYAKFAIIDETGSSIDEPKFTTDGINIISAIEFASPMQEFVRNMVKYIGSRVDAYAKDGTTSSMIIVIKALQNIIIGLSEMDLKYSYSTLTSVFRDFLTDMKKQLGDCKFTIESLMEICNMTKDEAISYIAYNQAMTSSHGDVELSEAVTKMFCQLPEKAWQYVSFERETHEQDWKYEVVVDENQYSLGCRIYRNEMLRDDLGTALRLKNTKLITLCHPLMSMGDTYEQFIKTIETALENDEWLTIVMPSDLDSSVVADLDKLLQPYYSKKIAIFRCLVDNPAINDLTNLLLLRGISPANKAETFTVAENVEIKYENNILHIVSGLYENSEDAVIHPYVTDPTSFSLFNDVLLNIDNTIKKIKTEAPTVDSGKTIMYFQKMYNSLYLTKRAIIRIGGSAHDNKAAVDVCMDTVGAVRESLRHGFAYGAAWTMRYALSQLTMRNPDTIEDNLYTIFTKSFLSAIDTLHKCIGFTTKLENDSHTEIDLHSGKTFSVYDKDEVYIQPAIIDNIILERFAELALRFAHSCRVISYHSVFVNKEDD